MEAVAVDVGVAVAGEVATSFLVKVKKHAAYLYKYKDNLKALEDARVQLDAKRVDGNKFSDDLKSRLREAGSAVALWQSDANELHRKAEKIVSRNNISWLKIWSRYSSSKHAWELIQDINEKVNSAPDFGTSFDLPIAEGAKFNLVGSMEFGSRKDILRGILEALKDEDVSMCSLCGMGGIGKTTMIKNLVQIVEASGLFSKVAMVTVSQNPNFEKLQNEIIELLALKFDESSMAGRAKKLRYWLSNNKSLVILDDVWWQISDEDFESVGIPLAIKGCKIVVISRNEEECRKMGSKPNFPLEVLGGEEPWDLFVKNAEKCVEDGNLQETARKIVDECGGLPIAIVTIARALNDKPARIWHDSLRKLQKSNLQGVSGMENVYSRIQLSYDLLNDQEAQSCFRLCCLFPEDYDVPVETLVFHGWGLELFEDVCSMEEARDRVDSIIHKLKKSSLLLDGERDGCVKLHDIVRDFAISICSKYEYPYLVRCGIEMENWPEKYQYEKCSAISLVCYKMKENSAGFPVDLRCPNLKLLQLHFSKLAGRLPIDICDGMEELRVADFCFPSAPPKLTMQKKLRALLIDNKPEFDYRKIMEPSYFREILGGVDIKSLEILSLTAMRFSDFPVEIGLLCNLRCLQCSQSVSINYMPPGVLSKLVKLEELELPSNFVDWGLKEAKGSRVNASVDELQSLPLTSAFISLPKGSILEEKLVERLTRFWIILGKCYFLNYKYGLNYFEVFDTDVSVNWMSILLRKCDSVYFCVEKVKSLMFQQSRGKNGFPCSYFSRMKTLKIGYMERLEELFDGPYLSNIQQPCFTSLTKIQIYVCPRLKHMFPLPVATELRQLQSMEIEHCGEMEEIFYKHQVEDGNKIIEESTEESKVDNAVVLPGLKLLHLDNIPKLRIHYNGNHAIEYPSLEDLEIRYCNNMEDLSYRPVNAPRIKKLKLEEVSFLKNIMWLRLEQDHGISQLKHLTIRYCREMECLVSQNFLKTFFSGLEELNLIGLDSLKEIWLGPYVSNKIAPCFNNLTYISIYACPKIKHVFPLSVASELTQLQRLFIYSCEELEEIFYKEQENDGNQVVSSVQFNSPTNVEAAPTPSLLANPNDGESWLICPTPNSFFRSLVQKPKRQKHITIHQTIEEHTAKLDEKEDDDATADAIIVFPKLKFLHLANLQKLRIFYDGNGAIELPSLEKLTINYCYKIEALSNVSFRAPKVSKIKINYNKKRVSGENLNTMVKKNKDEYENNDGELDGDDDDDGDDGEDKNDDRGSDGDD